MKSKQAFTIIELLIALSFSSFIILGMMQSYNNVINFINRSRTIMLFNKSACLLFNQIERDISSAIIPILHEEKTSDDSQKDEAEENVDKDDKAESKSNKTKEKFFVGLADENEFFKVEGRRRKLFKKISFISTNPMQFFGQEMVRLVRVGYWLDKDKVRSRKDKTVYNLFRKETLQLSNADFKEKDEVEIPKKERYKYIVKTILVASNIKNLFVEYVQEPESKEREKSFYDDDKVVEKKSFVWGNGKENKNVVPKRVEFYISFWDEELKVKNSFEFVVPIFSYPTIKETKKAEFVKDKQQNKKDVVKSQFIVNPIPRYGIKR